MNREGRLANARATGWVQSFPGKHIVRGYRKWFGVDLLTAIIELRMLGVTVSQEYEKQVRRTMETTAEYRKRKKLEREARQRETEWEIDMFDDYFGEDCDPWPDYLPSVRCEETSVNQAEEIPFDFNDVSFDDDDDIPF